MPLPKEDPFSHPKLGKMRDMMLGNSITPNRPDEPKAVTGHLKNDQSGYAAPNTITLTLVPGPSEVQVTPIPALEKTQSPKQ